jgi:hypothetical protein
MVIPCSHPGWLVVWVFLIVFGLPHLPRAALKSAATPSTSMTQASPLRLDC